MRCLAPGIYHTVPLVDVHAESFDLAAELALRSDVEDVLAAVRDDVPTLTPSQRAILDFERQWWRQPGAKEQAIRDNFEMSPTRYYQTLNALLDLPEALHYDPSLVNRLQRLRTTATRSRRLR